MPRFRPRFTVRRLMVAVAVVALVLEIESIRRAWVDRRRLAGWYSRAEQNEWDRAIQVENAIAGGRRDLAGVAEGALRQADFYARYRRKWEAAAARPWLAVEPDSPEPR